MRIIRVKRLFVIWLIYIIEALEAIKNLFVSLLNRKADDEQGSCMLYYYIYDYFHYILKIPKLTD